VIGCALEESGEDQKTAAGEMSSRLALFAELMVSGDNRRWRACAYSVAGTSKTLQLHHAGASGRPSQRPRRSTRINPWPAQNTVGLRATAVGHRRAVSNDLCKHEVRWVILRCAVICSNRCVFESCSQSGTLIFVRLSGPHASNERQIRRAHGEHVRNSALLPLQVY
jgi:hypothetical protein